VWQHPLLVCGGGLGGLGGFAGGSYQGAYWRAATVQRFRQLMASMPLERHDPVNGLQD
jgi:hypothetical protein